MTLSHSEFSINTARLQDCFCSSDTLYVTLPDYQLMCSRIMFLKVCIAKAAGISGKEKTEETLEAAKLPVTSLTYRFVLSLIFFFSISLGLFSLCSLRTGSLL